MGILPSKEFYQGYTNLLVQPNEVPKVIRAGGGDLGSMGSVELTLLLGEQRVKQQFIGCR